MPTDVPQIIAEFHAHLMVTVDEQGGVAASFDGASENGAFITYAYEASGSVRQVIDGALNEAESLGLFDPQLEVEHDLEPLPDDFFDNPEPSLVVEPDQIRQQLLKAEANDLTIFAEFTNYGEDGTGVFKVKSYQDGSILLMEAGLPLDDQRWITADDVTAVEEV